MAIPSHTARAELREQIRLQMRRGVIEREALRRLFLVPQAQQLVDYFQIFHGCAQFTPEQVEHVLYVLDAFEQRSLFQLILLLLDSDRAGALTQEQFDEFLRFMGFPLDRRRRASLQRLAVAGRFSITVVADAFAALYPALGRYRHAFAE